MATSRNAGAVDRTEVANTRQVDESLEVSLHPRYVFGVRSDVNNGAIVSVFDLASSKRVKTLRTECGVKDVDCIAFSGGEGKYLVALSKVHPYGSQLSPAKGPLQPMAECGSRPDYRLSCWDWDQGRMTASVRLLDGYPSDLRAVPSCVLFSVSDGIKLCTTGVNFVAVHHVSPAGELTAAIPVPEQLKCLPEEHQYSMGEPNLSSDAPSGFEVTSHIWTEAGDVICGTSNGKLLLFDEYGVFKQSLIIDPTATNGAYRIMAPWSRGGFLTASDDGIVRTFRKNSDDPEQPYRLSRIFSVDPPGKHPSGSESQPESLSGLREAPLKGSRGEEEYLPEKQPAKWMLCSFHTGPVLGMDVCVRRPIVATCGADHTVRLWNFWERRCELEQYFMEEAFSIALHPSGLQALVGFVDRLRLMDGHKFSDKSKGLSFCCLADNDYWSVLKDELKTYKDFPQIKSCRECRFSSGGHLFAAASGNNVEIYKTFTCERVYQLKGHNNKVRAICWNWDDTRLVSGGMDGAVYEYDMVGSGQRLSDWVNKSSLVSSAAVWTDTSAVSKRGLLQNGLPVTRVYAVGNNSSIREVYSSQLQGSIDAKPSCDDDVTGPVYFGQICLGESTKTLFVSTSSPEDSEVLGGAIRCYRLLSEESSDNDDSGVVGDEVASAPTSRPDAMMLFTCGEDGCVYVFEIRNKSRLLSIPQSGGAEGSEEDEELPYSEEVLMTKTALDEKQHQRKDLRRQVEELANQTDYQLRHRDSYHAERIAALQGKFEKSLQEQRDKYEMLREEKDDVQGEYERKIRDLLETQKSELQEQEIAYQEKIVAQVTKCQQLAQQRHEDRRQWKQMHQSLLDMHENKVAELRQQYQEQEARDRLHKQRVDDEKALAIKVHSETVQQLEQDAVGELNDMKAQNGRVPESGSLMLCSSVAWRNLENKFATYQSLPSMGQECDPLVVPIFFFIVFFCLRAMQGNRLYEQLLSYERDDKVKLRGEAGIHKKHHEDLRKQMHKKEEEIRGQQEEARRKQDRIDELMAEREKSLKNIKEQDKVIGEKEQKIYDLKKQNQELEKFKYIMDYKIKELKAQVGPKEGDIAEMKKQISDMDRDLEEHHKQNKHLMDDIKQMRGKQKELQREVVKNRQRLSDLRRVSRAFKTDLYHTTQHILDPEKLRDSFVAMAKKYVELPDDDEEAAEKEGEEEEEEERDGQEPPTKDVHDLSEEIRDEYEQQRGYLEEKVNKLRTKLQKDAEARRKDNSRIMGENIALLTEIGELRKELQALKMERQERKMSVSRPGPSTRAEAAAGRRPLGVGKKAPGRASEIEQNRRTIAELREKIRGREEIIRNYGEALTRGESKLP
ncbi:WD repeat domain 65 [Perkinsus olseni]|uniref:WD repeat domain 65 n=1 Tax=Perkinsus olseni TaxID=32597 RepID=A0A7J6LSS1_PEROL|nr:WD repeat domain 65 [Perkinsus olseni]